MVYPGQVAYPLFLNPDGVYLPENLDLGLQSQRQVTLKQSYISGRYAETLGYLPPA